MATFLTFLKKIPLLGWVVIAIGIFFLVNYVSSKMLNRSLFNMALDNLRQDQSNIIKEQKEWIETCEKSIRDMQTEIEKVQKEKALEKIKAAESAAEVIRLKGRVNALQLQIDNIVVSNDPDRIISDLQGRGFRIRRRMDTR